MKISIHRSNKVKGDRLESLIQYVYQTISDVADMDIKVKRQHAVVGKSGIKRTADVYYEFYINDILHKVIIECKNWKTRVPIEKVSALNDIINDVPHSVGIIISPEGFQSGAKEYAERQGIVLISESDKTLFLKAVGTRLSALLPSKRVYGQPFWFIYDSKTGSYMGAHYDDKSVIPLFISKKIALEYLQKSKLQGEIRGLSNRHLKILCGLAKEFNWKFGISLFDLENCFMVDYYLLEDYFIINEGES